jgi:TPR repeat protein
MKRLVSAAIAAILALLVSFGPAAAGTAPENQPVSEAELSLRRGNELLAQGDIIAARRFFERAASAGNATATMLMGTTFDPLFYKKWNVVGIRADPSKAVDWYLKAVGLGDPNAAARLRELADSGHLPYQVAR